MTKAFEHRGIRWRSDVGFEMRCDECARRGQSRTYWPLDLEFWRPRAGLARCRACQLEDNARRERERYWNDPEYRARKLAALTRSAKDRAATDKVKRLERYARLKQDPVRYAEFLERVRIANRKQREKRKAA